VVTVVALADLRSALGLSGVAVLTYYAITNAAALTLPTERRRWPRALAVLGLAGCVLLAFALPADAVLTGSAVLLAGVVVRRITTAGPGHRPAG
jgi:APA family basic amino acid/polyamine antiporter